jgi:hypothetical protein
MPLLLLLLLLCVMVLVLVVLLLLLYTSLLMLSKELPGVAAALDWHAAAAAACIMPGALGCRAAYPALCICTALGLRCTRCISALARHTLLLLLLLWEVG